MQKKSLFQEFNAFAAAHLCEGADDRDAQGAQGGKAFAELWSVAASSGVLGIGMPQALGGRGGNATDVAHALEGLGRGCTDAGLCLGLSGQLLAVQMPLIEFGSDAQKAAYLPDLIAGKRRAAVCLTEADAGSDTVAMKTSATRDGDEFVISGTKHYVGNGPLADTGLIFAKTAPERGQWGISAFVADLKSPAVCIETSMEKMGLRSLPMAVMSFDGLRVPGDALLGTEGSGAAIMRRMLEWERALIFAAAVGTLARHIEDAAEFAQGRSQFGKPIVQFQSVSNRLADMRVRYETARLTLHEAARVLARGENASMISAIANLHLSEACYACALDALRIYGGAGYLKGHEIERSLRDLAGGLIYSGTSDIQRNIIAGLL